VDEGMNGWVKWTKWHDGWVYDDDEWQD